MLKCLHSYYFTVLWIKAIKQNGISYVFLVLSWFDEHHWVLKVIKIPVSLSDNKEW